MQKVTKESVFKPSKIEAKGDATTRAARAIIDKETDARDAKTARLKAARLAKEASDLAAAPPPAPAKKTVRKSRKAVAAT